MENRKRGTLEMFAAMAIAGTVGWFVVESGRSSLDIVFWRCVFALAALLVVNLAMGLHRRPLTRRLLLLSTIGGIAIVLNWVLLFAAYSRASIAVVTAVYNTQPFILVGLGAVFLAERFTAAKAGWLGLAFLGTLAILQGGDAASGHGEHYLLGIAMALGAAILWAVAALATKFLTGTPPHLIALIHVMVGVLVLLPFTDFSDTPKQLQAWTLLATIGIVHTALVYMLMYAAIQRLETHVQGALSFVYPAVAIGVDFLAYDRRLSVVQILGMAAIFAAIAGMQWRAGASRTKDIVRPPRDGDAVRCAGQ